jgi:hypothetical protein
MEPLPDIMPVQVKRRIEQLDRSMRLIRQNNKGKVVAPKGMTFQDIATIVNT